MTIDALDDLLDQERLALLSGDFQKISEIHERKTGLIDDLAQLEIEDREQLVLLNDKVQRNQAMLNSAVEGIRAVARRLTAVRRIKDSLETYDATGQRTSHDVKTDRSLEKRA